MTEWKNIMLISPDDVKAQGELNYNVDDTAIGASIRVSQNVYLRDVIGDDLLGKLQELVWNSIQGADDNINSDENIAYKTLLDDYIQPVLAYKVSSEICVRITLKIRNMGVVKNSDTNVNQVSLQDIIYLKQTNDTLFNDALNRMVKFICDNNEAFPESEFVCGCGKHPLFGNTGLWLGK